MPENRNTKAIPINILCFLFWDTFLFLFATLYESKNSKLYISTDFTLNARNNENEKNDYYIYICFNCVPAVFYTSSKSICFCTLQPPPPPPEIPLNYLHEHNLSLNQDYQYDLNATEIAMLLEEAGIDTSRIQFIKFNESLEKNRTPQ